MLGGSALILCSGYMQHMKLGPSGHSEVASARPSRARAPIEVDRGKDPSEREQFHTARTVSRAGALRDRTGGEQSAGPFACVCQQPHESAVAYCDIVFARTRLISHPS